MNTILALKNVDVGIEEKERLLTINLSINHGDKIALIGKSGSGKSTLIKVANGTLTPSKGEVLFKGTDITKLNRTQRSQIATLWQDLRLIDEISVGQNINTGALGRHSLFWSISNLVGLIEIQKCIACLEASQLSTKFINKRVSTLSSGQRRRVAIARLLRQESELVLADEPLADLDPNLSEIILNVLLKKRTSFEIKVADTCIISIHQPNLIKHFNRVVGIKEGRIIMDCACSNITSKHLNRLYD
ncbi:MULTISPECIES: phosphonate ABC transporter ATP-binding protein [Prochlorococcus]|uniref:ABC-type phosphate/phosphonate transport system ATPase component n=1 Tax=Prochlorococcus marinus (strain SARG / CCMP1375 / SS120) TaxID=167539 RepID=Q7VBS2_PROMA|nr:MULTISPECIES: phosphonate ABC transporter ATP-binding protein [Prochlorococcus]AAQ00065.1 ABC-type phosphate/phosphonate transport system ATPase component [Prochlorococcus marinus subsp. marinus str. CCMP1375]KGG13862.1 Phosphonate ABC transporter ATP-binding protein [Prochlorococcus marinus str. LG]KGG18995.1 Phosphonate ABC transporter ATP-binding protein [Prochlorococcus marinus str. SS2]KGG23465.1 Phosphonate ABC transporter ATP-binding protein [Prochlorococcus marinus str. SS35]KGG3229